MSFDSLLINTCDVLYFSEGGPDPYGNPAKTWHVRHNDIPCRHISGRGREVKVGAEVIIIYDELFLEYEGVVVTNQDRILIGGVTYEILDVLFRQDGWGGHHNHLFLQAVK